ncbi:hypothetical protein [Enterococcus sp. AZ007]|uniref:hypothetical protein n=1 Tax=Enterococcus sp. AZ007 TaxID=2774839 RepID=UPI003F2044EB
MQKEMKTILTIFGLIIVAVFGYILLGKDDTTEEIKQTWDVSPDTISKIKLNEGQQNMKINYTESPDNLIHVTIEGKVAKSVKEKLTDKKFTGEKNDQLEITFAKVNGIGFVSQPDDASELTMEIALPQGKQLKKLEMKMTVGDISIMVPQDFQGKYKLRARDGEKIKAVPETDKSQESTILVNTSGTITIEKK